jgi:hypothetical protein
MLKAKIHLFKISSISFPVSICKFIQSEKYTIFRPNAQVPPYYGTPKLRSRNFDKFISVLIPSAFGETSPFGGCKPVSNKIWKEKGSIKNE